MSPEKIRISIAQACGWQKCPFDTTSYYVPMLGKKSVSCDPINDLNAIQEAVLGLKTKNSQQLFEWCLSDILNDDSWLVINATAAQRAEAFLKTIGKWEDGK